jgi:hypothetical protein
MRALEETEITFREIDEENKVQTDYPQGLSPTALPFIGNKTISFNDVLNYTGKRFHKCLLEQSRKNPNLAN